MSSAEDRSFFGHPKGLAYLLGAEAGWAFAYYGLQISLTLYMTQTLLRPGHVEHVLGFSAYAAFLRSVFGPLTPLGIASQTFGIATGLIYALPILGGMIADRWTGQRRAAMAGVLILTVAQSLLISERTFLIALALMTLGTGLLKTSLVGQLGRLYAPGDDRRTRGFGLYLIALNTGSFLTPLIAGTVGERLGWSSGFAVMAVGTALGAACYFAGVRYFPPDVLQARSAESKAARRMRPGDGRIIAVLLLLIVLDGIWSGVYNQAFNIFPVWADAHVERHVLGFLMPVTWFNTVDGVMTIVGTAVAVRVWGWQGAARRERHGPAPHRHRLRHGHGGLSDPGLWRGSGRGDRQGAAGARGGLLHTGRFLHSLDRHGDPDHDHAGRAAGDRQHGPWTLLSGHRGRESAHRDPGGLGRQDEHAGVLADARGDQRGDPAVRGSGGLQADPMAQAGQRCRGFRSDRGAFGGLGLGLNHPLQPVKRVHRFARAHAVEVQLVQGGFNYARFGDAVHLRMRDRCK